MIKCNQTKLHIAIDCTICLQHYCVSFHSIGKVRPKIQTLLDSLTELSKLLYLPAQSRSPKLVLQDVVLTSIHPCHDMQRSHWAAKVSNEQKVLW